MENEVSLEIVASDFTKVKESLSEMVSAINKATVSLEKLEKTSSSMGKNTRANLREVNDEIGKMGDQANLTSKKMSGLGNTFGFLGGAINATKKITKALGEMVQEAVNYSEELNLFNVVFKNNMDDLENGFSDVGLRAERFQQQLNEAFGTNMLETRRYQALFQSMGENMGIVTDKAEIMSTNLTKLTYDIASLYNASEKDVGQALQAGIYAGQTKPLRRFGIDVTQVSMQPIADELGLEKSISELSQAEKQMLRYLSVLRQTSFAQGDFANTIESPANQLKIFKQQCVEARIALGNLFIGAYARLLPYANAILMVIKEVAKAIASFFGIKVEDFNTGISSSVNVVDDLGDSFDGVGSSAGKASKAVKELNRQTLKFDQINNIKSPTPPSGSSGGGGGGGGGAIGGIDKRILDALKGYENGMEKVRMKANEIRDKIMEWLGFTKKINPLTGEISWEYGGIKKTLSNMLKTFNEMSLGGKLVTLLGIGVAIGAIVKKVKLLTTLLGNSGMGKILAGLLTPTKTLLTYLITSIPNIRLVNGAISTGINSWRASLGIIDGATGKFLGLTGVLKGLGTSLIGLSIGGLGFGIFNDALKKSTLQGETFGTTLGKIGGGLTTVIGGVQAGASMFGVYGGVVGGVLASMILLGDIIAVQTDNFLKLKESIKQNKKATDDLVESIESEYKAYEKGSKVQLDSLQTSDALVDKLDEYTYANGQVREGYEEQVKFIMNELKEGYGIEGELIDGRIKDYDNYIKKIQNAIETKRAEIYLKEYEGKLTSAIKNEAKLYDQMTTNLKTLNDAHAKRLGYEKEVAKLEGKREKAVQQMQKLADEGQRGSRAYLELENKVRGYDTAIQTATTNQRQALEVEEKAKTVYKTTADEYAKAKNTINTYSELSKAIVTANETGQWDEVKRIYAEGGKKTTQDFINSVVKQSQAIHKDSDLSKEMLTNWQVLASLSKKKYNDALKQLPEDTRTIIDNAVKEINGSKTTAWGESAQLGEGVGKNFKNSAERSGKTTLKVNADTSQADRDFINLKQRINGQTVSVRARFTGSLNINGTSYSVYDDGKASYLRKNALGGIFSNGVWKDIKQYANGGVPSHGTVFTAGERGPEVVGHIGRRTEVLNQSQLASVMYEAVSNALSNTNFGGIEFYAHTDEGVVIDKINRVTRQTGKCPIEV